MQKGRVVLFTAPSDQGDILQDFLDWHLDLGVDDDSVVQWLQRAASATSRSA